VPDALRPGHPSLLYHFAVEQVMNSTPGSNGSVAREPASAKQQAGREANGRFAPGNPGGPGNPFARKVAALRKAVLDAVSVEDIQAVFAVLLEKAKAGDTAAAKLVLQYAVGKPGAAADPDRVDVAEWQLLRERSRPAAEMGDVMNGTPVDVATKLTGIVWPCKVETRLSAPFRVGLAAMERRDGRRGKTKKQEAAVPAAVVERLARAPLEEEAAALSGAGAPSANGGNGRHPRKGRRGRNGKRR
jgi:hypothetical protein